MNRNVLLSGLLVAAIQVVSAWGGDVAVVTTLPAHVGTNFKSNIDLSGAVGLKHAVSFNGGGFVVYDKATGKVLERLSQSEFWTRKVAASYSMDAKASFNDPKMIYDPLSDRWFATVAPHNISYLAVSTSGDPTKPWKGVILPLPRIDPGLTIGVDKNGLYVCAANGNPDSQEALDCLAIPIADATSVSGPVLTNAQSFTKLHFMAYPAMDSNPDKAPDAPAILMNNEFKGFTGCGKLYLYKITWAGAKASISEAQTIPLSKIYDTSRPECEQPGSAPKLRAASAVRTESIVVHGGSVFGCHAAKLKPEARLGIVWYEVRIKDGALLQEGFVDDPKCDYLYPSLALDRAGNLGIGCSRVSRTEYPSIYVMMRAVTDPPGTMRPPVLVVPGTTSYRWGPDKPAWCHYSSTCVDPADPDLLWTCQPYSASKTDKEWCTAWTAFKLSAAAAPTSRPAAAGAVTPDSAAGVTVVNVTAFGAKGDGVTDDRPSIQAAIDALAAKGGGVLRIPKGKYLLNSYRPGAHPWGFYNLLVGSRIHIEGEPGATLLQGEKGRAPLPQGATIVGNAVLVVGTPLYAVVTCQNTNYNGGFYSLNATVADTSQVKLTRPTDAAHFAAGDYVAIYATTTGDVLPTELTRVKAVTAEGELTLVSPLARSFSTPQIANVTERITSDVSLKNLIVQGARPLTIMETWGFSAEDCQFLADTRLGHPNAVTTFDLNTVRYFRFVRNVIGSVGPEYVGIELPQRNSQDGLFEENTVRAASVGFGEYGAHWRFLKNHMWLYPRPETAVAVSITGLDVLFSGNDVHCGKLTGGQGWGCVLTDFYAPGDYAPYVGKVRIADNTIECEPGAAYSLLLRSRDPVVTGNRLRVRGSGAAIRFDGDYIAASITNNDITVDTGAGIMLETGSHDACTIARNRIAATKGSVAIHVASPSDKQRIVRNTISGFAQDVVRERAK